MDSLDIYKALSKSVKHFKGVFPLDKLPSSFSLPAIFVINLDTHKQPGSHWIAISITDSGHGEYFDSYGIPPLKHKLIFFLRMHTIHWKYNKIRLQGSISNVCGQYCCVYALCRGQNIPMKIFTSKFSRSDFCVNDKKIIRLYRKNFGKCIPCDREENHQNCISLFDIVQDNM